MRKISTGTFCGIGILLVAMLFSACSNISNSTAITDEYVPASDKLLKNISAVLFSDNEKQCRVEFCHTEDFYETVMYEYDSNLLVFEATYNGDNDYNIDDLLAGLGVIYATKELSSWDYDEDPYPYYMALFAPEELDGPEFTIDAFKAWGTSCETNVTRCPWKPKVERG